MTSSEILINLDLYYKHNWNDIYDALVTKDTECISSKTALLENEISLYALLSEGYKIITLVEDDYPKEIKLKTIKPPFVIYYKGDFKTIVERFFKYNYIPAEGCFLK